MAGDAIVDGFEVFVQDGEVAFGAVREVKPHGKAEIVIYVENTGDFVVPLGAVREVNDGKVVLDSAKLSHAASALSAEEREIFTGLWARLLNPPSKGDHDDGEMPKLRHAHLTGHLLRTLRG